MPFRTRVFAIGIHQGHAGKLHSSFLISTRLYTQTLYCALRTRHALALNTIPKHVMVYTCTSYGIFNQIHLRNANMNNNRQPSYMYIAEEVINEKQ